MDIKGFKLIGGPEFIAHVVQKTTTGYEVKHPLAIHMMKGPDGQGHLAFAPLMMVADPDESVSIREAALCAEPFDPIPEIAQSYIEQTTGIALSAPPSGKILMS